MDGAASCAAFYDVVVTNAVDWPVQGRCMLAVDRDGPSIVVQGKGADAGLRWDLGTLASHVASKARTLHCTIRGTPGSHKQIQISLADPSPSSAAAATVPWDAMIACVCKLYDALGSAGRAVVEGDKRRTVSEELALARAAASPEHQPAGGGAGPAAAEPTVLDGSVLPVPHHFAGRAWSDPQHVRPRGHGHGGHGLRVQTWLEDGPGAQGWMDVQTLATFLCSPPTSPRLPSLRAHLVSDSSDHRLSALRQLISLAPKAIGYFRQEEKAGSSRSKLRKRLVLAAFRLWRAPQSFMHLLVAEAGAGQGEGGAAAGAGGDGGAGGAGAGGGHPASLSRTATGSTGSGAQSSTSTPLSAGGFSSRGGVRAFGPMPMLSRSAGGLTGTGTDGAVGGSTEASPGGAAGGASRSAWTAGASAAGAGPVPSPASMSSLQQRLQRMSMGQQPGQQGQGQAQGQGHGQGHSPRQASGARAGAGSPGGGGSAAGGGPGFTSPSSHGSRRGSRGGHSYASGYSSRQGAQGQGMGGGGGAAAAGPGGGGYAHMHGGQQQQGGARPHTPGSTYSGRTGTTPTSPHMRGHMSPGTAASMGMRAGAGGPGGWDFPPPMQLGPGPGQGQGQAGGLGMQPMAPMGEHYSPSFARAMMMQGHGGGMAPAWSPTGHGYVLASVHGPGHGQGQGQAQMQASSTGGGGAVLSPQGWYAAAHNSGQQQQQPAGYGPALMQPQPHPHPQAHALVQGQMMVAGGGGWASGGGGSGAAGPVMQVMGGTAGGMPVQHMGMGMGGGQVVGADLVLRAMPAGSGGPSMPMGVSMGVPMGMGMAMGMGGQAVSVSAPAAYYQPQPQPHPQAQAYQQLQQLQQVYPASAAGGVGGGGHYGSGTTHHYVPVSPGQPALSVHYPASGGRPHQTPPSAGMGHMQGSMQGGGHWGPMYRDSSAAVGPDPLAASGWSAFAGLGNGQGQGQAVGGMQGSLQLHSPSGGAWQPVGDADGSVGRQAQAGSLPGAQTDRDGSAASAGQGGGAPPASPSAAVPSPASASASQGTAGRRLSAAF